jgi:hypothetical protein
MVGNAFAFHGARVMAAPSEIPSDKAGKLMWLCAVHGLGHSRENRNYRKSLPGNHAQN